MRKLYLLTMAAMAMVPATLSAEIPKGYYDSLKGLKGAELKNALTKTARPKSTPSYGSGYGGTWYYFWETDRMPDGKTWRNRYSDETFTVGSRGDAATGMNIEHSFPRSWFGGKGKAPDNDLFNLYPSPSATNGDKSNYIMDKVAVANTDKSDGYTTIGTSSHTSEAWAWEPNDSYKGDFSRGYMYMITAWKNDVTFTSRAVNFMNNDLYPALFDWAAQLYSSWCRLDKPDRVEIDRNDAIYKIQGNRNPYIDFPNLFEYLWGDSTAYAFDPEKTVVAGGGMYTPGDDPMNPDKLDPTNPDHFDMMDQIYYADYTQGDFNATETTVKAPGTYATVWKRNSKYGWVANSYINGTRYESDGTIYTAEINLDGLTNAYVRFEHAVNFLPGKYLDYLTVMVECDDVTTNINDKTVWPAGNTWNFVSSGVIDLSAYAGKKVRLGFRYTSTTGNCGAWEIKNIEVRGGSTAGIDDIYDTPAPEFDPTLPAEYFTIDGRRTDASARGVLIVRQQGRIYKIMR
ncbi:endonuclease [uncultured Muribaculum sp.]|uniref:endonuclease n=1 Tax=uncultured Muribaculum sp. TaxID=1918613 RepID=UPI0025DA6014|nr:endonuclease [uncultured Muribaculum sp.]